MTVTLPAEAFIQAARGAPYPAAVTVPVHQPKRQAFNPIGSFQHDRQTDGHGGNTERPRQWKKQHAKHKNNHACAEQKGADDQRLTTC